MTLDVKVAEDVQQLAVGEVVVLYKFDATSLGSTTYYFTQAAYESSAVTWQGNIYTPIDVDAEGFELSGRGTLPRPKFRIANTTLAIASAVLTYNDLVGAVVTRYRTLRKYLDGEPGADPTAYFPEDVYVVERKTAHNKTFIEWELSAYMDFEGKMIPRRQVLRDTCTRRYRYYTDGAWDYSNADCPYANETVAQGCYFMQDGTYTTDPTEDTCGRRSVDCKLRFVTRPGGVTIYIQTTAPGSPSEGNLWLNSKPTPALWWKYVNATWVDAPRDDLPTWAFPGVALTRV